MVGYIKGLSYDDAKRAVFIVTCFAQDKLEDPNLSFDERVSWKDNVCAHISIQAVTIHADSQLQIDLINVVLSDNECGFIDSEIPFLCTSMEEKDTIIQHATSQHLTEHDDLAESKN